MSKTAKAIGHGPGHCVQVEEVERLLEALRLAVTLAELIVAAVNALPALLDRLEKAAAVASEAHATADDIGAIPSLREAAVILRRFARQLEQALAPTAEDGDGR